MEVKARIIKHKSTIGKGQTELPVPAHFVGKGHSMSQLRYRVIDSVPSCEVRLTGRVYLKKEETLLDFYL